MEVPEKAKNRTTIWPCNLTPIPRNVSGEKHDPKGHIHQNARCNSVYNNQDMEAT